VRFHRCLGSQYRFVGLDKALTAFYEVIHK
jgi:hypothetical protein